MRVFAGTAFQGEEEHAARHLVGCGPCSALAAEVVAELAARQALAPGKSSVRVLADLLREKEEMFVRSLQAKAWVAAVRALPEAEQARAVREWKDLRAEDVPGVPRTRRAPEAKPRRNSRDIHDLDQVRRNRRASPAGESLPRRAR